MGPNTGQAGPAHPADRLTDAVARLAAPVCVGLDPVLEKLPGALRVDGDDPAGPAAALVRFGLQVLDAVAPYVPAVKLQSACFERYGHRGVEGLGRLVEEARSRGLVVILDAKRGDIDVSARHYAAAVFGCGSRRADWVTVSAYLGPDAMQPYLEDGGAAFALVRTSNPGGDRVQALRLEDGRSVAEAVAGMVAEAGRATLGRSGYSSLGAVVGATRPAEAARLRALMPAQILLVPGYGAQGATAGDVRACFDAAGGGAVVNASRSVIYAFRDGLRWEKDVAAAAERFADEIGRAAGLR